MEIGDTCYFVRHTDAYELIDLKIRTVTDRYIVGVDSLHANSSQQSFHFFISDIDKVLFKDENKAKHVLKECKRLKIKPKDYEED